MSLIMGMTRRSSGLLMGGLTTQYTSTSWRTYFYLVTGFCVLLAVVSLFAVPGSVRPHRRTPDARVDWLGALLAVSGFVLFTFALAEGEGAPQGWKTPYIPALLVVGFFLILAFIGWQWQMERRENQPLMRLSIWRKGRFAVLQMIAFSLFGGFVTYASSSKLAGFSVLRLSVHHSNRTIFFGVLYWENYEYRSIVATTLRFLPLCIVGVIANVIGAVLVANIPAQILLITGITASGLSSLLLAVMDVSKPCEWYIHSTRRARFLKL